jgi:hypothetical protein
MTLNVSPNYALIVYTKTGILQACVFAEEPSPKEWMHLLYELATVPEFNLTDKRLFIDYNVDLATPEELAAITTKANSDDPDVMVVHHGPAHA